MTTLYDIAAEYRAAMVEIHEADGEVGDDIEARLDAIGGDLSAKVDAIAKIRAEVLGDAAAYKAEAARLTDRKRTAEKKAARLRDYLGACLRVMGQKKVKTSTHTVSLRPTPPRVVVDVDPGELPEAYRRQRDPEADLSALKLALKVDDPEAAKVAHLETTESVQVR